MTNSCRPGAWAPLPEPHPTTVAVRHRLGPAPEPNVGTVGTALQAWATDLAVVPTA